MPRSAHTRATTVTPVRRPRPTRPRPTTSPGRPRLARRARLRFDKLGGRWLLMWPERSLALNRTSTDIVRMLDGEHTVDDIISQLGERYTADRARIAEGVSA